MNAQALPDGLNRVLPDGFDHVGEVCRPPDKYGLLRELREMLLHSDLGGGLFD